jgi:hypothetical protein
MAIAFSAVSFLVPNKYDPEFNGSFHCVGLVFTTSPHERCLLAPVRFSSSDGDKESIGIGFLSFPTFIESASLFRKLSSIDGNVFTTDIVEKDRLHSDHSSASLRIFAGEIENLLSTPILSTVIRAEDFTATLAVTSFGLLKLTPSFTGNVDVC